MKLQILTPHWQEEPSEMLPLLDSLALQQAVDFRDIGMIVVYDGVEATPLPEEDWKAKYPFRIDFITIPHGGVSAARNAALDAATADYIMFCDSDDMVCEACGLYVVLDSISTGLDAMTSLFLEETRDVNGNVVFVQHKQDCVFVHGKVWRRQYLIDAGIRFDPALTIHEDRYFNILAYEMLPDLNKAVYLPNAFYLWRWRDNSVCRRDRGEYMLRTYVNLIDSDDALAAELVRRNREDKATKYVVVMVLETYYTMQTEPWLHPQNAAYRTAVKRRMKAYLEKWGHLWNGSPYTEKTQVSNNIRARYIANGMQMERQTLDEWLSEVL